MLAIMLLALVSGTNSSAPVTRSVPEHMAHDGRTSYAKFSAQAARLEARRDEPQPHFLTPAEQARLKNAFDVAALHDWATARKLAVGLAQPAARKVIEWRYLVDPRSTPSFAELNEFLAANPGWPRQAALLVRAETSIPVNADANFVVGWFGKRQPISGFGQIRLGEAEIATGKSAIGEARIRRAWVDNAFDGSTENRILTRHGKLFTAQLQQQRLARMLLKENYAAVRRQLPRVQHRRKLS